MGKTTTLLALKAMRLAVCLNVGCLAAACASGDLRPSSEDSEASTCDKERSDNRLDCITPLEDVLFAQAKGDFAFTLEQTFTNRKDQEITWAALNGPFEFRFFQANDESCATPSVTSNSLSGTTELQANAVMTEDGPYYFCVFADSDQYPTIAARNNGFVLTLDTVAPQPPILSGGSITTDPQPRWDWRSEDPTSANVYRAALGSEDFGLDAPETVSTFYQPEAPLEDGSYTIYVQVRDEAGNWSQSARMTTIVDATSPAPTLVQVDTGNPALLQVLVSFAEPVNGLATEDLRLTDATLDSLSASKDMKTYTAYLAVTGDNPTVSVAAGCCTDAAGNLSLAGSLLPLSIAP